MLLKESPTIGFDYHRRAQNVLIDIFQRPKGLFSFIYLTLALTLYPGRRCLIPSGCPSDASSAMLRSSSLLLLLFFLLYYYYSELFLRGRQLSARSVRGSIDEPRDTAVSQHSSIVFTFWMATGIDENLIYANEN